jgi:hypothetical protein
MDILTTIGSVVSTAGAIHTLTKSLKNDELSRWSSELNMELAKAQNLIAELLNKNRELEQECQTLKDDKADPLQWKKELYWKDGDDVPFCPHCYEGGKFKYHLHTIYPTNVSKAYHCTHCNNHY